MLKIFIAIFITTNVFALSPFSLEGIKDVNLKVMDKSKLTSEDNLNKIQYDVKSTLEKLGIKTKSVNFSNFIVKIQGVKAKDTYVMHISMFIVEDVHPSRDTSIENMSITYYKDDLFDTNKNDLQTDIYESVINYLLSDLIEQHKEENN